MLKERINEILDKNKVSTEGGMRDGLRKDMESLAMDYYTKGEVSLQEVLMPKLLNLKELVKAQKELIALYDAENLSDPAWLKESELRNKIKTLEQ